MELGTRNTFLNRCAKGLAYPEIALTPCTLRALVELSQNERLCYLVKGLVVRTGQLAACAKPEYWNYIHPDEVKLREEAIKEFLAEQAQMDSLGIASDMLSIALSNLPNCDGFTVQNEPFGASIDWFASGDIENAVGRKCVFYACPREKAMASTFRTIGLAFIASGKTLRTLGVTDYSMDGIKLKKFADMVLPNLDIASPLLKGLQELELQLVLRKTGSLRQLLKCAPNLQILRVRFSGGMVSVYDNHRLLSTVLVPKYMPKLRCLDVTDIRMDIQQAADFAQLLTVLRDSLRELSLETLTMEDYTQWKPLLHSTTNSLLTRLHISWKWPWMRPKVCLEPSWCSPLKKKDIYRCISTNIPQDVPQWIEHLHQR
jgi:hypothetical protein